MHQSRQCVLLACYESIGLVSRRMLNHARTQDWEGVAACERACSNLIERITDLGNPESILDGRGRRRRVEILRDVLARDAEIRDLAEPSLARLDAMMLGGAPG